MCASESDFEGVKAAGQRQPVVELGGFKVGDRVQTPRGAGEIVGIADEGWPRILVKHDDWHGGHNGNYIVPGGEVADNAGWYYDHEDLKLLDQKPVESIEDRIKQADFELVLGLAAAAPLGIGPRDIRLVRYLRESAKAVEAYGKGDFKTVKAIASAPENAHEEFHDFNVLVMDSFFNTTAFSDLSKLAARMRKMADNLEQQYHSIAA